MTANAVNPGDLLRPDVTFVVPGEPVSKSRHKTGVRGGKVYHYKDHANANAQDRIGLLYRQARGPGVPLPGGFGVSCTFFLKSRQRRDVDNFIKLIFDGLTGMAWIDDSQVTEVHGRIVHGADDPRSEIRVFPTDDLPDHLSRQCQHCGGEFRTYSSWGTAKKYCSADCRKAAVSARRARTCQHCGKQFYAEKPTRENPFCSRECKYEHGRMNVTCAHCGTNAVVPRASVRRGGNWYCNEKCRADHWRGARKANAKGACLTCGGPTSKKTYTQCRACSLDARREAREK